MQFSIDSYSSRDSKEVPYAKKLSRAESVTDHQPFRMEVGPDGKVQIVPEDPPPLSPPPPEDDSSLRSFTRRLSLVAEVPKDIQLMPGDKEKLERRREYSGERRVWDFTLKQYFKN